MSRVIGAYICPRGVFAIESRRRGAGMEVERTFSVPAPSPLGSARDAAARFVGALAAQNIRGASVAIALRGFDVVHHVLGFPPAPDDLLGTIVDRELRRLEPQLADPPPVIAWTPLPTEAAPPPDVMPQRQVLVAACSPETIDAFDSALRGAGHRLLHLTALPAAIQRLEEELIDARETTAIVAPLPDGVFIGFFLAGALRLAVEPPLADADDRPDSASIVEELELGAIFVRQQFRGAQVERVTVAHGGDSFADVEGRLTERLGLPVQRLDVHGLPAAALAAMGAVLDAQSAHPLALAGSTAGRRPAGAATRLHQASWAAVAAAALVGAWAMFAALSARTAANDLRDARSQVQQESFAMLPMRATASHRKIVRDAVTALRYADADRVELQRALAAIAGAVAGPVRLDSLQLDRGASGWLAQLRGTVSAQSNGLAVQGLHDFYRRLPLRLSVEGLALDEMAYRDATAPGGAARLQFQLSFELPMGVRD
ncbi:MAG: hypothetical protein WD801_13480 [Gemmatimonadaceae bacterium]